MPTAFGRSTQMKDRMVERSLCRLIVFSCVVAWTAPSMSVAQEAGCAVDMQEVGRWDMATVAYADVWAEGDTAFVGQWGGFGGFANGVHFFDISNPAAPDRFLEWIVGPPNQFASAQDVKTGDGMLFISLESDPNDGVEIVDIRDPRNPVHVSWIAVPGMSAVHNTFYDSGFLYIVNSGTPDIAIVDLTGFDLDDPPVRIQQAAWNISAGNVFVHDVTVRNGVLYASAWDSGLFLYDVTNVATVAPVFLGSGPGNNTHAAWPSDDGRWVAVGEERGGGPVKLYEIIPNGGGVDVVLRDTFGLPGSETNSSHNPVVVGTRVYVSWYQAGTRILDIDEDQGLLIDRGGFDTFSGGASGFNGAWGVYPFLGEDRILVSDMTNGLFVLSTQSLISVSYPVGLVTDVHPTDGAMLSVEISGACGSPDPSTAKAVVEISPEGGIVDVPLVLVGPDLYEAQLPGAPCGSTYTYYVTVDTFDGETVFDPPGAPVSQYEARVLSAVEVLFADDFEQNTGWTTEGEICADVGAGTGAWERVDPNGTGVAPEDDFGDGTMCFVTEQGVVGGTSGEADVDGGPFRLISPSMAIGGNDAVVRYARWFASNGDDTLVVEISADGGANWDLVEEVTDAGTQWVMHEFAASSVITPGDSVVLRFSVQDCPNGSITEAAIDEVSVTVFECVDDAEPPVIVHDGGVSTHPHSGYVDPRRESDDGVAANSGITTLTIAFSKPVRNIGGSDLDASAFTVTSTGVAAPAVASINATDNPVIAITLTEPLLPGSWYTIVARVEDGAGNVIIDSGDLGPGVDEADRVDIGFLPADVDQNGEVGPFDLLLFRQFINGVSAPAEGVVTDFVDTDRNGAVEPFDLLSYRQLVNGVTPSTQPWAGATLDAPRP